MTEARSKRDAATKGGDGNSARTARARSADAARSPAEIELLCGDIRRAAAAALAAEFSMVGVIVRGRLEVASGDAALGDPADPGLSLWAAVAATGQFAVGDASTDPRLARHPSVVGPPHLRCFVGAAVPFGGNGAFVVLGVGSARPAEIPPGAPAAIARYAGLAALLFGGTAEPARAAEADGGAPQLRRLERQALSMAHVGAFRYDFVAGTGLWSDEMFRILGLLPRRIGDVSELAACFTGSSAAVAAAIDGARGGRGFDFVIPLETPQGMLKLLRLAGRPEIVDDTTTALVGTVQEISKRGGEGLNAIPGVAEIDALTGLPTRRPLERALGRAVGMAQDRGGRVGLVVVDLDYFREVNRIIGEDAGDRILQAVADRLLSLGGWVARLRGDEFAIVFTAIPDAAALADKARAAIELAAQPVTIGATEAACRASAGAAIFPDHATTTEGLLEAVAAALLRAKSAGRGIALLHDPGHERGAGDVLQVHAAIRDALGRDEIVPFYQPKVELVSGALVGLEALARWQQPAGGAAPPNTFEAAFADGSVGQAMTDRILEKVTDDMRGWLDDGLAFGHVSINATTIDLVRGNFPERLGDLLLRKGIPFDHLQVEVTETIFLEHEETAIAAAVSSLDAMGIAVGLDDFGTGYGTLIHLRRLAVRHVKIDRGFIACVDQDGHNRAVVAAIVRLCRDLGKDLVVEGVEREEERLTLIGLGCRVAQGFLFGVPEPTADMRLRLERLRGG